MKKLEAMAALETELNGTKTQLGAVQAQLTDQSSDVAQARAALLEREQQVRRLEHVWCQLPVLTRLVHTPASSRSRCIGESKRRCRIVETSQ